MSNLRYKLQVADILREDRHSYKQPNIKKDVYNMYDDNKYDTNYKNREDIKDIKILDMSNIDEVDFLMAKFSWEISILYTEKKLDSKTVKMVELLLEKYRVYLQTYNSKKSKNGYAMNGSQRAAQPAVSSSSFTRFTTPENRRASSVSSQSRFLTPEDRSESKEEAGQNIINNLDEVVKTAKGMLKQIPRYRDSYGRLVVDKQKILEEFGHKRAEEEQRYRSREEEIIGEFGGVLFPEDVEPFESKYDLEGENKELLMQKLQSLVDLDSFRDLDPTEQKQMRESLFGDRQQDVQSRMDILEQMKHDKEEQLSFMCRMFQDLRESNGDSKSDQLSKQLLGIEKLTKEMAEQVRDLQEESIRKQSLSSVSWGNLPTQIRLLFAKGFWEFTFKAIALPITAPTSLVNNIIIQPAWYSTKILFNKFYFLWGCVCIFIIIGNVGHIYISNEERILNIFSSMTSSDNIFINTASNYVSAPAKVLYERAASRDQLYDVWHRIGTVVFGKFGSSLYTSLGNIKDYLTQVASDVMSNIISKLNPLNRISSWW